MFKLDKKAYEGNGMKNVSMEIIKYMDIHISDTLMLTQMELDVRLNHGR